MKVTRLYTGSDGESHFEDIDIPMKRPERVDRWSKTAGASGIIFRETDGDYDLDYHNSPYRGYVINLEGSVEVVLGDGSGRIFGPGEIILAEDITGRGHISRAVDNRPRKSVFVTID